MYSLQPPVDCSFIDLTNLKARTNSWVSEFDCLIELARCQQEGRSRARCKKYQRCIMVAAVVAEGEDLNGGSSSVGQVCLLCSTSGSRWLKKDVDRKDCSGEELPLKNSLWTATYPRETKTLSKRSHDYHDLFQTSRINPFKWPFLEWLFHGP